MPVERTFGEADLCPRSGGVLFPVRHRRRWLQNPMSTKSWRVAESQARAQNLRCAYVHSQKALARRRSHQRQNGARRKIGISSRATAADVDKNLTGIRFWGGFHEPLVELIMAEHGTVCLPPERDSETDMDLALEVYDPPYSNRITYLQE